MSPREHDDLERDLDDLFAAEPGRFVRARDDLARRLRKAGDRDTAAEVAKLRKPTAVAWALNQLARRERGQVEALLKQDEHLRALMQSAGRGDELRKAADKRREIVRDLARVAGAILAGGGNKATPAATEKIFETLQAVATDAEAREALRSGRLAGEVRPSGFGEALAAAPAEDRGARVDEEAREQLAEARRTARERAEEAEGLRRGAERLRRAADEAERAARRARNDADRAAEKADEAEAAAGEAARVAAELEAGID